MQGFFHRSSFFMTHRSWVNSCSSSKYGTKSLRGLGSHILNSLSEEIKAETVCNTFEEYESVLFAKAFGIKVYKCNLCSSQHESMK